MNLLDQLDANRRKSAATHGDSSPDDASRDGAAQAHTATEKPICSRKACKLPADWQLLWNNPRIHTPERRKTWLACGEHREWLEDYLRTRGLWKQTLALAGGVA